MTKRKFNHKRLYKLGKIVTILLFIFCLFNFFNSLSKYLKTKKDFFNADLQHEMCSKFAGGYQRSPEEYSKCTDIYLKDYVISYNKFKKSSIITILIPILFFGGTALYKYLFPYKKKGGGNEKIL